VGSGLDDSSIERAAEAARESADVREDRRASADYRRELVLVGVKRSLHEARGRLAGGER
jgi:CO/xanthine dehydrogenase FAD-binding subunit